MDVLENINSDDSLYIFCDASVYFGSLKESTYISCAGVVAVSNRKILKENYRVIKNAVAPRGEIEAIKDGVYTAILLMREYPNIKNIYLFSDSELALLGIRDRIYNWDCKPVINKDYYGLYRARSQYNIGNGLIKHQDIYIETLYALVKYNPNIKFYHQKGHLDTSNYANLKYATELFKRNNNIENAVSKDFMTYISDYNNYVDNNSRSYLEEMVTCQSDTLSKLTEPVRFVISNKNDFYQNLSSYELNYGGRYNGRY